jgi:hypothetical protein
MMSENCSSERRDQVVLVDQMELTVQNRYNMDLLLERMVKATV